jgi:hypothetical protein
VLKKRSENLETGRPRIIYNKMNSIKINHSFLLKAYRVKKVINAAEPILGREVAVCAAGLIFLSGPHGGIALE